MLIFSATLLGYIGILSVLATVSPGNGPLGYILQFLPSQILDFLHAPAYGLLAWLGIIGLRRRGWPHSLALIAGCLFALVFGFWTETLQLSVPGRGLEIKDLVTDGLGIAIAGILASGSLKSVRASAAHSRHSHPTTT
jgi:VanZ family protein